MEQEYNSYEVRLNRLFNIRAKQNIILFAILLAASVAHVVINLVNNTVAENGTVLFCLACLAIMIVKLLSHPKYIEITPETVKFSSRSALLNLLIRGRISGGADGKSRYENTYTVYNIKSIEYIQSAFEKPFSYGHIRICGDVNLGESGKEERTFAIYGIKDFTNMSAWMRDYLKLCGTV